MLLIHRIRLHAALSAAILTVSINCARAAEATPTATPTAAPTLPPCVHAGPAATIPPEFPKNLPVPPGTLVTSAKSTEAGIVLMGFIPLELKEAIRFFAQQFPAAGYRLGRGEVDRGEAESRFGGNGVVGYFKIRTIPDCPGASDFVIRVQALPSTPSPTPQPK